MVDKSPYKRILWPNFLKPFVTSDDLIRMLQRILTGFTQVSGVDLAGVFDELGIMIASVSQEGNTTPTSEAIRTIIFRTNSASENAGLGKATGLWVEGKRRQMFDLMSSDVTLMISGNGGRLARWRHELDRNRSTIQELMNR